MMSPYSPIAPPGGQNGPAMLAKSALFGRLLQHLGVFPQAAQGVPAMYSPAPPDLGVVPGGMTSSGVPGGMPVGGPVDSMIEPTVSQAPRGPADVLAGLKRRVSPLARAAGGPMTPPVQHQSPAPPQPGGGSGLGFGHGGQAPTGPAAQQALARYAGMRAPGRSF